ncbi:GNAT family N-acetyltransferase [Consotaella salsifontis]|uniref:Ribosomal protein S18 acetylase RimI n=1 Tax=Consotaella salsifontis TaxID=1365950 RepID=A0A1T4T933_9HYPH|nr:GNAT family N-acetyltransferase [Consotaella salsifontis]SKA37024.1 Ribosomal protein S18 acetylase RimI [Consotaella salsifontis]
MKTTVADIRLAEPEDASDLAAVHDAAWRNAYSGIIPNRTLNAMVARRGSSWWSRALKRGAAILVLDFDGTVAGYATLGRNRAEALPVEGEIYELYLQPEFQGIGFGRRLFGAARQFLAQRGFHGLAVWSLTENDRAMAFYSSLGGYDIAEGEERFEDRKMRKIAFIWPETDRA